MGTFNSTNMKIFLLSLLVVGCWSARVPTIIGGEDADPGEWPFIGSLQNLGQHSCGVSLISDTWVVTAAHCVQGAAPIFMSVVLGTHDLESIGTSNRYSVKQIIAHSGFSQFTLANDIAVIELASPARGANIETVPMATNQDFLDSNCYIIGWGGDELPGGTHYPTIFQEGNVGIFTNSECAQLHGSNGFRIYDGSICCGVLNEVGGCYGDSGGPLVCDVAGEWILAGATSWGNPYCPPTAPSVYTRITYFRDWIRDHTGV